MFSLRFNGKFEVENIDDFLHDIQEVIKKHKVEYFGNIQTENLGQYVDFQKIEDEPVQEIKSE